MINQIIFQLKRPQVVYPIKLIIGFIIQKKK